MTEFDTQIPGNLLRSHLWRAKAFVLTAMLGVVVIGCGQDGSERPETTLQDAAPPANQDSTTEVSSVFSELSGSSDSNLGRKQTTIAADRGRVAFTNVATAMGLEFKYDNGAIGQQLMVEATGGGCGWIDFDRDGSEDLYFPQGGNSAKSGSRDQPLDQLFRNIAGKSFQNVTSLAHIVEQLYGQGVAVGDYDNDGFDDLFVTNVGCNQLFQNMGDGTFTLMTQQAGVVDDLWSSSAAWGDIDLDGDLDLYVCNYCNYDPRNPMVCLNSQGIPSICHPKDVIPVPDECYRNLGDGRFVPCAKELGLFGEGNRGLGVVIADFDNDHWPDIYVANDTTANFLFLNEKGTSFKDVAIAVGCAVNAHGVPQASMGIACGDYDRNEMLDLYVTHFTGEWNTLYTNLGEKGFYDRTAMTDLVVPTMNRLAFGTIMADLNQDGFMEIFVANGHINPQEADGDGYPMRPQLFSFNGATWDDVGNAAGEYFSRPVVGRGVATGDFDADGKLDLCVVHHDAPVALLHNESTSGKWLQIRPVGRNSARNAVGTRVSATIEDEIWMLELAGGTSYCSSMQGMLSFGFPASALTCNLRIEWPSGLVSVAENVLLNQSICIVEPTSEVQRSGWLVPSAGK